MTLYEKILKYNDQDLNALYFENKTITYKTLLTNVRKLVSYFIDKGIKKGQVITVSLPNIPSTIYTFYALDAIGAIQNIVHPLTPVNKIIETMKETNSECAILLATTYQDNIELFNSIDYKFFFANPMQDKSLIMRYAFYLKFKKVKENNHLFLLDKFYSYTECENISNRDDEETSIYLHSGGTTGTPKVICLSDNSLNNLVDKVGDIVKCDIKGKSMLAVLPTFHGFGLGMGIHAPLSHGASSALMMKFNGNKVIEWINQNKVNMIIGVPLLYQKLLKNENFNDAKLGNLEFCFIGGDNVPPSLIMEFNQRMESNGSKCKLLEGYGLTETVTVCAVNTREELKVGSIGKTLTGINIKILDENFDEKDINEIGEVFITGDTLMNGYLNDEETTNKTLINISGEVYVRTGDLGYIDEEGYIFLKGRKKRMFKISGLNVYPSEVEKIASDVDDIIDASLEFFIEPTPHLVLYVIKNNSSSKSEDELKEIIMNVLKDKVLKYSLPKEIVVLDKFPQTNVGKINHQGFIDPLKNK